MNESVVAHYKAQQIPKKMTHLQPKLANLLTIQFRLFRTCGIGQFDYPLSTDIRPILEVDILYSTPKASSALAIRILVSVSKNAGHYQYMTPIRYIEN